jgi:hypothetical protein
MRYAVGLAVLTAGAILTFAVSAQVPGINLRVTGVIVILAGIAAMITPQRAAALLHLPAVPRGRSGTEEPDDYGYSAYLLQDPAVLAAEVLRGAGADQAGMRHGPAPQPAQHGPAGPASHDGRHSQG